MRRCLNHCLVAALLTAGVNCGDAGNGAAIDAKASSDAGGGWPNTMECGGECFYIEIPAGSFEMGCKPDHEPDCDAYLDSLPLHDVVLDAYLMRTTEVRQRNYGRCVSAGACTPPSDNYDPDGIRRAAPVTNVTWQQASEYCLWAGGRLPTEAEWEKAAKGETHRSWPWGDFAPMCNVANFAGCVGGPGDQSGGIASNAYPIYTMAGNVAEWVSDYYDPLYYTTSPADNPIGPASGAARVVRGGSYEDPAKDIRTFVRKSADGAADTIGFRCAHAPLN